MRQLLVFAPEERSDEVVEVLQKHLYAEGRVSRSTQDGISTVVAICARENAGKVLHALDKIGCGVAWGRVALVPVAMIKPLPKATVSLDTLQKEWDIHSLWIQSASARMAIEEIYLQVDDGTRLSFDYILYILVAACVATLGLATNNTVMIVAAMLLSPLMGPILGFSLGTVMRDRHLILTGIVSEVVGILVTFIVGLIYGLIISGWQAVPDFYDWPTAEMASRGEYINLFVGFLFAVPSGVGVSLACTQGGVNMLVGVAIAASLLPPICNTGLNLGFGLLGCSSKLDQVGVYNRSEFLRIAGISFVLFIVNVVSIYITCIVFFWAKRIRPIRRQTSRYTPPPAIVIPPHPKKPSTSGHGPNGHNHNKGQQLTTANVAALNQQNDAAGTLQGADSANGINHVVTVGSDEVPAGAIAVAGAVAGTVGLVVRASGASQGSIESGVSEARSSKHWNKVKQAVKEKQMSNASGGVLHEGDEHDDAPPTGTKATIATNK